LSPLTDQRSRKWLLLGIALVGTLAVIAYGPIPQPPGYHAFADQRRIFGIANFWNVASNLPFLAVGLAGLLALRGRPTRGVLPALRPAYFVFFLGTILVAFGSGYYHLAPSDESLAWDRLPMTISFMAFFPILVGEQIRPELGARLLLPLLMTGVLSVIYWRITGDLRPYVLVQFLPIVLAPLLLLLFSSALTRVWLLWMVLAAYAVAKLLEMFDAPIFRFLHGLSGHSLKHVVAAVGTCFVLLAATKRTLASQQKD
jgi:hypothetical protein